MAPPTNPAASRPEPSGPGPALLWFRQDLRLNDHRALARAMAWGGPVIPVYIWSPEEEGRWPPGSASRAWLHDSLSALAADLLRRGSRLILRAGPAGPALARLCRETGARQVAFGRRIEPAGRTQEASLERALGRAGIEFEGCNTVALHDPGSVMTMTGGPYRVFTPFYRACLSRPLPHPARPAPATIPAPARWPQSDSLRGLGLAPPEDRSEMIRLHWKPGEAGARMQVRRFLDRALESYGENRDFPARRGTSLLSPHLHFGEISPGSVWRAVQARTASVPGPGTIRQAESFLRQILWREFALHLLYHFPRMAERPMRPEFAAFPWSRHRRHLEAWREGRTGEPLVDAGMRQLRDTGWMHNRVRMIAASYLVKDLLIAWHEGARWFWENLVDADLANNSLGWQWCAGCGPDAAPFVRIFHPALQAERFDPERSYVERWVPELRTGRRTVNRKERSTYPPPLVDHSAARRRALAAFALLDGRSPRGKAPAKARKDRNEL